MIREKTRTLCHAFYHIAAAAVILTTVSCTPEPKDTYQGYIEGDYLYVSCSASGKMTTMYATKGSIVNSGDPLFELDPQPELSAYLEAQSIYNAARARYEDSTRGMRPSEIDALRAALTQAETTLAFSTKELKRTLDLYEKHTVSDKVMDAAQSAHDLDAARVKELKARLRTAGLGARQGQVEAARGEMERAKAGYERASWLLGQKSVSSPVTASVVDVLYLPGEFLPPGYPAVVLLPDNALKVRFFIPEPMLSTIKPGSAVDVIVDGRDAPVSGFVTYIAPKAEYTPPFIYNKVNREKFVFMVEASFDHSQNTAGLNPGMPVDVKVRP